MTTTPRHPLAPAPIGLEYGKLLAHGLSRRTAAPAYVVNQDGHYILVDEAQMREGWYQPEQVVYVADAAHVAAL